MGMDLYSFSMSVGMKIQMVSSLECASEWLSNSNFIISYSDIFYTKEAVRLLLNQEAEIAITYDTNWLAHWSERFDNPFEDAESFSVSLRVSYLISAEKMFV